jgi:hypothetical protein
LALVWVWVLAVTSYTDTLKIRKTKEKRKWHFITL